jgi:hypothetical protein
MLGEVELLGRVELSKDTALDGRVMCSGIVLSRRYLLRQRVADGTVGARGY